MKRKVFLLAWQFVKRNGLNLSNALKRAWANIKLLVKMQTGIVKFYFLKVDSTIREAYGTLCTEKIPGYTLQEGDKRKKNDTVQTYYDTEKQAWRCFKKANLVNY